MKACENADKHILFTFNKDLPDDAEEPKTLHAECEDCGYTLSCKVEDKKGKDIENDRLVNLMMENVQQNWRQLRNTGFCGKKLEMLANIEHGKPFDELSEREQGEIFLQLKKNLQNGKNNSNDN